MQRLRYSRYLKISVILLDMLIVVGVFLFFFIKQNNFKIVNLKEQNSLIIALLILFWILLSGRTKLYSVARNLTYTNYLERIISHIFIFLLGVILLAKASNNEMLKYERFWIGITLFSCLFLIKSIIFVGLKYIRLRGINIRNIMFLAENSSTEILKNTLVKRKDYGFKLFDYKDTIIDIPKLKEFWKNNGIHTLYLPSENYLDKNLENEIFKEAELNKVRISLIPNIIQNDFFEYDLNYIETQPILNPTKYPLDFLTNSVMKRTFDLLLSLIVLIGICSWLFPILAILIKLNSKGPIFFLQKRYGFHEQVFSCYKFRTMIVNQESSNKTTQENDSRITKIGKFLRKTSLDEFPQFINVLKGEMSIIGPRPHMILVDDFFKPKIGRYSVRSRVKPGISGLAQVNGLRGDDGDMNIEMKKRILADSFYVKNWSLSLDFVIIIKTIFLLLIGDKKAR